jgi:hypothetical protein
MRRIALAALSLVVALPQGTRPTVRVTTSYSMTGGGAVDTAAATKDFVSGLGTESLIRVLPPLPRRTQGGDTKIEAAEYGVMLSIMGGGSSIRLQVRAINVKTGAAQLTESAQTASPDSIPIIVRELGRAVARGLGRRG